MVLQRRGPESRRRLAPGDRTACSLAVRESRNAYAPPVRARHQPELPYWHLRSDGLWEVPGAEGFARQSGGFPQMAALRASMGHLAPDFAEALLADRQLVAAVVGELLEVTVGVVEGEEGCPSSACATRNRDCRGQP